MRRLYSLLLCLALPAVLGHLAYRGLRDRAYLARWGERFGYFKAPSRSGGILVHAVSMGEVNAASPLVQELARRYPDQPLYFTCFTPTGSARVQALFGDRVFHVYAPLDLPGPVRRLFDCLRPRLLLVMETEIWPNLYYQAERRGVPVVLANARLTERSLRRYRRVRRLAAETLSRVTAIAAQTAADAARLVGAGAPAERVTVTGNLKYDVTVPADLLARGEALRRSWGRERLAVVGGSTHELDERALLAAFGRLLADHPRALLVLVPRHPERFGRAAELARAAGLRVARRSEHPADPPDCQCFVVDAMGELPAWYAAADVAFLGGTLAPVGGHNPIEAMALGRPLLFGPHTQNVRDIADELLTRGGARRVGDATELEAALRELLGDADQRDRMGRTARALVEAGQGAVERTLAVVERVLTAATG